MKRFPRKIRIAALVTVALAVLAIEGNRPNPQYAWVFYKMARRAEKEGRTGQAVAYYQKALRYDPERQEPFDVPDYVSGVADNTGDVDK